MKIFVGPNWRPVTPVHGMNVSGYADAAYESLEVDGEELDGIPVFIDPASQKTEKIHVGRYAYRDRCVKCGAVVHIAPDGIEEKPASVVYNQRFQIIGCPACMGATKARPK